MIRFFITGQRLRIYTPVIAADTIEYLTAAAEFSDEWEGYTRWAHFRCGQTVYDIEMQNNRISEDDELSLHAGEWEVYITGVKTVGAALARLTSTVAVMTVVPSGIIGHALEPLPASSAEQLDAKASAAVQTANRVKADAESGKFSGLRIAGYVESTAELPEKGDGGKLYAVGTNAPYTIYGWDAITEQWKNNGSVSGITGAAGKYAVPLVDEFGNLSWLWSDGTSQGLPEQQNIRGETGPIGTTGETGKSAYETAAENGFEGTEEVFNNLLGHFNAHAESHAPEGSDPLPEDCIVTENIAEGAVTNEKINGDVRTEVFQATVGTNWWLRKVTTGYWYRTILPEELPSGFSLQQTDTVTLHFRAPESAEDYAAKKEAFDCLSYIQIEGNFIDLYAAEKPRAELLLNVEVRHI